MKKDRFGICLTFYAVLAFVLTILGQTLLGGLLLAFVILAEQDEWLIRQTMQAFFLSLISGIVSAFMGAFSWLCTIPILGILVSGLFGVVSVFFSAVTAILSLVILIFAVIGLVNVAKGKDAGVPLCKGFADKAFGLVKTSGSTQAPPAGPQDPQ